MIPASGSSHAPLSSRKLRNAGEVSSGTRPREREPLRAGKLTGTGIWRFRPTGWLSPAFTGYRESYGAVGCGGVDSVDGRRGRADPGGPGRGRFEEGVDRLRDRDRGRFEHRIDRQGEVTDRIDDRLDRMERRLARLEDRAERLSGDRERP